MKKRKVGVLFCGGCNYYYDRWQVYLDLQEKFKDECEFGIYRLETDEHFDAVVLINGCQSECLLKTDFNGPLMLLTNKNYEQAPELLRALLDGANLDIRSDWKNEKSTVVKDENKHYVKGE